MSGKSSHDFTLATNNVDEFCRIAALRVENWEHPTAELAFHDMLHK